jgi:hypothetical protein
VRALEWNGREIRNALQTAVALAETEALESGVETVAVAERHMRAVVKMSSGFKEFLRGSKNEREHHHHGRGRGGVVVEEREGEGEGEE